MLKIVSILLSLAYSTLSFAQQTLKLIVKDDLKKIPLAGVSIQLKGSTQATFTDSTGYAILKNIPTGKQTIVISSIGFGSIEKNIIFPYTETIHLFLEPAEEELEEIKVVTSTRSSRNIEDIPTRIEGIPKADLDEKSVMQPGNIKMLVSEIAGVQTQQTSQVSGSASIRIQGLEGKYTLLLQNGMPLYSGLASGLSILQIPPLNLKRVEVIKGASSTLYGGGAIAGLINLITKEPVDKREISFLINANHTHALDLSSFYSEKYHKTGMSLYTTANLQKAYDVNKDGFSDIPKFNRYSINPSFYYYPNATTTFSFGIHAGVEKRTGGDMQVINLKADSVHSFYEINNTERYSSEARLEKHFSNNNVLTLKNSVGFFNRKIARPFYGFEGKQIASFSEMNLDIPRERSELNLGINYISDHFKQMPAASNHLDYHDAVWGLFVQDNVKLSSSFIVETGLRLDFSNRNNTFLLPRLSLLYKITHKLTTRLGGGFGYKTPTIFSDDAEEIAFKNIEPLNFAILKPERSYGLNADLNYKSIIFEKLNFSVNQLFFYTIIKNPLLLNQVPATNNYAFENAPGNIESKGFETAIKLHVQDISCYIGYTYTDVKRYFNHVSSVNPVTAKHHLDIDLMYELNEKLRVGYELYYVGSQFSTNGEKLRSYWEMGLLSEYKFKQFSLFINFENLLDTRQSRWGTMYSGTLQDPQFKEVYAPTDGFILNTGLKFRW